jgi:hypothetical protein
MTFVHNGIRDFFLKTSINKKTEYDLLGWREREKEHPIILIIWLMMFSVNKHFFDYGLNWKRTTIPMHPCLFLTFI